MNEQLFRSVTVGLKSVSLDAPTCLTNETVEILGGALVRGRAPLPLALNDTNVPPEPSAVLEAGPHPEPRQAGQTTRI